MCKPPWLGFKCFVQMCGTAKHCLCRGWGTSIILYLFVFPCAMHAEFGKPLVFEVLMCFVVVVVVVVLDVFCCCCCFFLFCFSSRNKILNVICIN